MCPRRRSAGRTSLRTSLRSGAAAIAGCAELTDSEAVLPELDEVGERLRPVAHERAAGVGAALRIPELAVAVGDVGVAACPEHEDRNPLVHRVALCSRFFEASKEDTRGAAAHTWCTENRGLEKKEPPSCFFTRNSFG